MGKIFWTLLLFAASVSTARASSHVERALPARESNGVELPAAKIPAAEEVLPARTWVSGYVRSDGRYVAPHWRKAPLKKAAPAELPRAFR